MPAKDAKYSTVLKKLQEKYKKKDDAFIIDNLQSNDILMLAVNLIADYIDSDENKAQENASITPEGVFNELNYIAIDCKQGEELKLDSLIEALSAGVGASSNQVAAPIFVNLSTYNDSGTKVARNTLCVITHSSEAGLQITHYKNDKQYNDEADENVELLGAKLDAELGKGKFILKKANGINVRVNSSKGGYSIAMAIADSYLQYKDLKGKGNADDSKPGDPLYYIDSARISQDAISIAHLEYHYKCLEAGLLRLMQGRSFDISLSADRSGHYDYESVAKKTYKDLPKDKDGKVKAYNIHYQFTQEQIHTLVLQLIYHDLYQKGEDEKEDIANSKEGSDESQQKNKLSDGLPKNLLSDEIDHKKMEEIFHNLKIIQLAKDNATANSFKDKFSFVYYALSVQLNIAAPDAKLKNPVFDHAWYNKFKASVANMFQSFETKISKLEEKQKDLHLDSQNCLEKAKGAKGKIEELCKDFTKLPDAKSKDDISLRDFKILLESVYKMLQNPPIKDYWVGNNWHESSGNWNAYWDWSAYTHSAGYNALGYLDAMIPKLYKDYSNRNSPKFSCISNEQSVQLERYILDIVNTMKTAKGETIGNPDKVSAPVYIPYTEGSHHVVIAIAWNKTSNKLEVQYYNSMPSDKTAMKEAKDILSGIKKIVDTTYIDQGIKRMNEVNIQAGQACGPITALLTAHSYLQQFVGKKEGLKPFADMRKKMGESRHSTTASNFYEILCGNFFRVLDFKYYIPKAPVYDPKKQIKPQNSLDELKEGYQVNQIPTKEEYRNALKKGEDGKVYDQYGNIVDIEDFKNGEPPLDAEAAPAISEDKDADTKGNDGKPNKGVGQNSGKTKGSSDGASGNVIPTSAGEGKEGTASTGKDNNKNTNPQPQAYSLWSKLLFICGVGLVFLATIASLYVIWKGGFKYKCSENALNLISQEVAKIQGKIERWMGC